MSISDAKKILHFENESLSAGNNEVGLEEVVSLYDKPTVVVIFGASGDLTRRKLIPAFYSLVKQGYLADNFKVIGASRTDYSDEQFRNYFYENLFKENTARPESWDDFSKNIYYHQLDVNTEAGFVELLTKIESLFPNKNPNLLCYLSTAPSLFSKISDQLGNLLKKREGGKLGSIRLIAEKPFGECLESSKELNRQLRTHFKEEQIFRIDHYLGKETVQNILVMRFLNSIFEPLWNSRYIEQIQISVCEDIGVGTRADFFDRTGITKDFVQNHILQMLSLLCIESPLSLSNSESIRDEKVKVLKSIKRYSKYKALKSSVLGQYKSGIVGGVKVPGYRDEVGVPKDSLTETFVALRLEIENWRWSGVPVYIKVGKRLQRKVTEISVFFKRVPSSLMRGSLGASINQNVLKIQVQPKEGVSLSMNSKLPGQTMSVSPVELDFSYAQSFSKNSPEAYERLLLEAIKGESALFIRDDEIEEAWSLLEPFFDAWGELKERQGDSAIEFYEAGSCGPDASSRLFLNKNHAWRKI